MLQDCVEYTSSSRLGSKLTLSYILLGNLRSQSIDVNEAIEMTINCGYLSG